MIFAALIPAAVIAAVVLVSVLVVQRARGGAELTPRALLRVYLYLASLAGLVVLAIGLASVVNYGLAVTLGDEVIYGGSSRILVGPVPPQCPPGASNCAERTVEQQAVLQRQQDQQRERRRNEELLRGITFGVFGGLFWGAHWMARRGLGEDEGAAGLRRGYLMVGTVVFGIASLVMLPTGVYQALANVLLVTPENTYRQGADALGGAIVVVPIWLLFLRLVVVEFRRA